MICQKCGEENKEVYGFCTNCGANLKGLPPEPAGFSPPANPSSDKNVESFSSPTVFSAPVSGSQATVPPADSMSETIAVPTFASNLSYREPKGNSNKFLLIAGAAIGFVFFLIVAGGAFVWWQLQKSDQQTTDNQNLQVKAGTNTISDSNSSNLNALPNSSADDEFTRLQSKLNNAAPNEKHALDSELARAENKYPNDYRFTYQRAKLETVGSKEHHEAFEMLFAAGEKAIKSNKSADLLSDLQRDKILDLKRLTDHQEWRVLQNALQTKNSKALDVKGH